MNCWQILKIKPTNDKTQIKRAFAKCVKENPPDKDAAVYQQIREAYSAALKFSEYIDDEDENDETEYEESAVKVESSEDGDSEESEEDEDSSEDYDDEEDDSEYEDYEDDEDYEEDEEEFDEEDELLAEKEPLTQSVDMAEIQKLRESMQNTENARSLSEIAGEFDVRNWHFSEDADYSCTLKFIYWIKIPVFVVSLILLIVWMVSSK